MIFFKVMGPPDFQDHGATRQGSMIQIFRVMGPGSGRFCSVMGPATG